MIPGEHTGIMDLVSSILGNHNVFDKLLSTRHYYMLFIFILTYTVDRLMINICFNGVQPQITKLHNHVFDYVFYVGFCSCEYVFLNMIPFTTFGMHKISLWLVLKKILPTYNNLIIIIWSF